MASTSAKGGSSSEGRCPITHVENATRFAACKFYHDTLLDTQAYMDHLDDLAQRVHEQGVSSNSEEDDFIW